MASLPPSVYADVAARARILVECSIVRDDRLRCEFADLLAAAAARGVATRLLYAPFGSHRTDPRFFAELRRRGVDAPPYQRRRPLLGLLSLAPRNHSRNIVIDAAYAGGQAWPAAWLPRERGGQGWYDLCCRVVDPVVEDFAALCALRWAERPGRPPRDFDTGARHPGVRLIADSPSRQSLVFAKHVERFHAARERSWIANSSCSPPMRMEEAPQARRAPGRLHGRAHHLALVALRRDGQHRELQILLGAEVGEAAAL